MATSSARYVDLYDYARTAEHIDREIVDRADRLANKLSEFQAKCREPRFQVDSSLGPAMRSHGKHWEPIDQRVRTVADNFYQADKSFWRHVLPFPRWVFQPPWFARPPWTAIWPAPATGALPIVLVPLLPHIPRWIRGPVVTIPGTHQPGPEPVESPAGTPPNSPVSKPVKPNPKLFEGGNIKLNDSAHEDLGKPPRGVAVDIGPTDKSHIPTVHALRGGTVVGKGFEEDGYGHYIKILQDDGTVVIYAHLAEAPSQNVGDPVSAGTKLAQMGSTGKSTGTHLHVEFREPKYDENGNYVTDTAGKYEKWDHGKGSFDPLAYLREQGIVF